MNTWAEINEKLAIILYLFKLNKKVSNKDIFINRNSVRSEFTTGQFSIK